MADQPQNPFDLSKMFDPSKFGAMMDPAKFGGMMDPSKFSAMMDPAKMMTELSKLASQYKVPGLDNNAWLASQRGMIEAIASANQQVMANLQGLFQRQVEMLQEMMESASKAFQDMAKSGGQPQDVLTKQAEFYRTSFEKGLANMRELTELTTRSCFESMNTLGNRVASQLEQMKSAATGGK